MAVVINTERMMQDFNNTVAVVTGGAGGIGKALVKALLDDGAKVVIADVEDGAMEAAVAECSGEGRDVSAFKVDDVRKPESVEALVDFVYAQHGACHLLFNNASFAASSANIWETTPNDWAWIYSVNVIDGCGPRHTVVCAAHARRWRRAKRASWSTPHPVTGVFPVCPISQFTPPARPLYAP
eukprot:scaffold5444_cov157-Amphora_coffeaeformis.AAC.8